MYVFINVLRLKVIFFFCITESVIVNIVVFVFFSHKMIIHDNNFYRGAYTLQALLFSRPSFPFNFMFIF